MDPKVLFSSNPLPPAPAVAPNAQGFAAWGRGVSLFYSHSSSRSQNGAGLEAGARYISAGQKHTLAPTLEGLSVAEECRQQSEVLWKCIQDT